MDSTWTFGLGPVLNFSQAAGDGELPQSISYGYGLRTFARMRPFQKLPFLQAEYEGLSDKDSIGQNMFTSSILLGAGHTFKIDGRNNVTISVMRNLNWSGASTAYPSPWAIRMGLQVPLGSGKNKIDKVDPDFVEKYRGGIPLDAKLDPISFLLQRLKLEGTVSVTPGDPPTIDVSPTFNYSIDSSLSIGVGPALQFQKSLSSLEDLSVMNYGGRAYLRYQLGNKLPFAQVEYEGISALDSTSTKGGRSFVSSVMLGAGYDLKLSKLGGVQLTLLRNLSYDGVTPVHNSPWVLRTGWTTGMPVTTSSAGLPTMDAMGLLQLLTKTFNLEGNFSIIPGSPNKVELSPMFNIPIDSVLSLGLGISYRFEQDSLDFANRTNEQWGGRAYLRYRPKEKWPYAQLEAEALSRNIDSLASDTWYRNWESGLLLGAGYELQAKGWAIGLTVLRDLGLGDNKNRQASPWVWRTTVKKPLHKPKKNYIPGKSPPPAAKEGDPDKEPFSERIEIEGNIGLVLGPSPMVDFSPLVGYKIKDYWLAGLGPSYQFQKDEKTKEVTQVFGGRMFTRLEPEEGYPYLQAEYEYMRGQTDSNSPRTWKGALLLGGGVNFPIGKKASFLITVLRDATWDRETSIRNDPWVVRAGLKL
ncbi:hypothetical protein R9208_04855 [Flammeovirgaceae bacterium SG7u.132]|nr:hypothetical protein [Flammeovirgaceae bacterium SG7u.132]